MSLDFERIGYNMAFRDVIQSQTQAAATSMAQANAIIADKNEVIDDLYNQIAQLKAALAVETARNAGFKTLATTFKGEMQKVAPKHALLAATGKAYPNGAPQLGLNVVYEAAYDAEFARQKVPGAVKTRAEAK